MKRGDRIWYLAVPVQDFRPDVIKTTTNRQYHALNVEESCKNPTSAQQQTITTTTAQKRERAVQNGVITVR